VPTLFKQDIRRGALVGTLRFCPPYEGAQPFGASSNFEKSKPGATVHPTKVQSPVLVAACHARAGTIACGASPAARSGPSLMLRRLSPSAISSFSALPA
jgi:hypothetical protein